MIQLLDHGYVKFIDSWGSDAAIVEAARMSTGKGFKGWGTADNPGDEKLLRYLWEHKHMTPFEMAGMVIEVKAPIFVFREWHRHRTQSYNEMSARYVPLPDENYVPSVERLMRGGGANKQAQGTGTELTEKGAEEFRRVLRFDYAAQQSTYESALAEGVPKELARVVLPVGRYSAMRASANLRNWLAFCELRSTKHAPGAQWEIQQYADAVSALLWNRFPKTFQLYDGE